MNSSELGGSRDPLAGPGRRCGPRAETDVENELECHHYTRSGTRPARAEIGRAGPIGDNGGVDHPKPGPIDSGKAPVPAAHRHFSWGGRGVSPRLLLTDLDGTLLDRRLELDPRDVEAAHRAQEAGTLIGVATGRMYRSALPYATRLETRLPIICYQGALIRELPSRVGGRVLWRRELPAEVALPVLELAHRRGYSVNVYQDDQLLVEALNDDVAFYTSIAQVEPVVAKDPPLEERLRRGTTKMTLVTAELDRFPALLAEVRELVGDRAEVTRSLVGFCEITARDVDKGAALRWLCAHLGVDPSQVIALGDAPNDLPLLRAAGTAVAVETAAEEVRRAAEWVAPGPGGGGLAAVVSHYQLDQPAVVVPA